LPKDEKFALKVTVDGVHIAVGESSSGTTFTYTNEATAAVMVTAPRAVTENDDVTVFADVKGFLSPARTDSSSGTVNITLMEHSEGLAGGDKSSPMTCELFDRFQLPADNATQDQPGSSLDGIKEEGETGDLSVQFPAYGLVAVGAAAGDTNIEAKSYGAHTKATCSVNAMGARAATFANVSLLTPRGRAQVRSYQWHGNTAYNLEYMASVIAVSPPSVSERGGGELTIVGTGFPTDVALLQVTVGGVACKVLSALPTKIVCRLSALPAGADVHADAGAAATARHAGLRGVSHRRGPVTTVVNDFFLPACPAGFSGPRASDGCCEVRRYLPTATAQASCGAAGPPYLFNPGSSSSCYLGARRCTCCAPAGYAFGAVRCGAVRCGAARRGAARCGAVQCMRGVGYLLLQ
jgi:hypothetical protein